MLIVVTDLPIQYSRGKSHLYNVECSIPIKYTIKKTLGMYQPKASDVFYILTIKHNFNKLDHIEFIGFKNQKCYN